MLGEFWAFRHRGWRWRRRGQRCWGDGGDGMSGSGGLFRLNGGLLAGPNRDGGLPGCHIHHPLDDRHVGGAVRLHGQGEGRSPHRRDRRGGLDLEARGRVRQTLYLAVGAARPLAQENDPAAIPPGVHPDDGELRTGLQAGRAPIEEGQRRGGERAGANPVPRLHPFARRGRPPGVAAGGQDLHHAAHLRQSRHLGDGSPETGQEEETADGQQDERQRGRQGQLESRRTPGRGALLPQPQQGSEPPGIAAERVGGGGRLAPPLDQRLQHPPLPGGEGGGGGGRLGHLTNFQGEL